MSYLVGMIEHVFDAMPCDPAVLPELDDASLVDAISGWARASAITDALKYAAVAELQRRRCTDVHSDWACDDWDAAAAEVAAALNVGHGRASSELDMAVMLHDRFPKVGALFLDGRLTARRVWLVANRTLLVQDADAVARLDELIAERIAAWGPLSEYKLTQAIDVWVDAVDPGALRRTRESARTRDFTVAAADGKGTAPVFGRLFSTDATLLDQRLAAMARGVCDDDPRTLGQRRADALGALAAGGFQLSCRCDDPDCPAAGDDVRATSVLVHVLAEASTTEAEPDPLSHGDGPELDEGSTPAQRRKAGVIVGGGPIPASLLAELIARGAKVTPVLAPSSRPEPRYRPSRTLDRFVRLRDLTCRFPGCDRPATAADIDHTVPYPHGSTHPGGLKCYCRTHHLVKTFCAGFSDQQFADGTVIVTTPTPTGHQYVTRPGGTLFFPQWDVTTPAPATVPNSPDGHREIMMPRRGRTRAATRADRIRAERALNDDYVAERSRPPPF